MKLTREHFVTQLDQNGRVIDTQTIPAGTEVVLPFAKLTPIERKLGIACGVFLVKVESDNHPYWRKGTWKMNFDPVDWMKADLLMPTGEVQLSEAELSRCRNEFEQWEKAIM